MNNSSILAVSQLELNIPQSFVLFINVNNMSGVIAFRDDTETIVEHYSLSTHGFNLTSSTGIISPLVSLVNTPISMLLM